MATPHGSPHRSRPAHSFPAPVAAHHKIPPKSHQHLFAPPTMDNANAAAARISDRMRGPSVALATIALLLGELLATSQLKHR